MRRVLPEHVELIPKGTHVVLTLGGFDDITGAYVRAIWDAKGDQGRGSGLIGLDRGKSSISWFGLGAHHVWIATTDAAIIELWSQYGIRGYPHPRGIVIRETDEARIIADMPHRPHRRVRMLGGVDIIVAPDWTFDPFTVAVNRVEAEIRRFGHRMLWALQQIWGAFIDSLTGKDRS